MMQSKNSNVHQICLALKGLIGNAERFDQNQKFIENFSYKVVKTSTKITTTAAATTAATKTTTVTTTTTTPTKTLLECVRIISIKIFVQSVIYLCDDVFNLFLITWKSRIESVEM